MKHLILQNSTDPPDITGFARVFCALDRFDDLGGDSGIPRDAVVVVAHPYNHIDLDWWSYQSMLKRDEWTVWWHIGSRASVRLTASEVDQEWRGWLGSSGSAFAQLRDKMPIPYSIGGKPFTSWDIVLRAFLGYVSSKCTFEDLDIAAQDGYNHYYGLRWLKEKLADLLPSYLEREFLQRCAGNAQCVRNEEIKSMLTLIGNESEDFLQRLCALADDNEGKRERLSRNRSIDEMVQVVAESEAPIPLLFKAVKMLSRSPRSRNQP
ncbi:MAG: hypothetical protein NTW21_42775 [Verrucomicrobia bacterium]|nr:hypothetical protein [Verrucomicrobiota bacterium]